MSSMAVHSNGNPSTHFGRQIRKERLARGWTLRELSARSGVDYSYLSKIESGNRPPTEAVADAMDLVFPERKKWFREYYEESRAWTPPGFRSWGEYEAKARELVIWCPGIVEGTAQTEDYARAVFSGYPDATPEQVGTRLKNRLERQKQLLREGGPTVVLLVDHVALYRAVGSADVMASQMSHLLAVATLPRVTVQVIPSVLVPLATALVIVTDTAAYTEHGLGGAVFTEDESLTRLRGLIGSVRGEARPVSESLVMIREARQRWTGANRRSAATGARRASKRQAEAV
jgi:transcriptional regulator with XRE-family HTH domain